ncbi:methyltransferase domain-containing protein [Microbispora sp. NPDC046933]|uniref:methyltransferase domain-containing protein n=1 Tax=Microbispora sp. NPDC046933 TaxID=3155618 RepID=UPI0033E0C680
MQLQDIETREGYDLWAETYEDSPNPVVAIDARHTMGILAPRPGERVLDAGCGTGRNLAAMIDAGAHPTGIDYSSGMLGVARLRHPEVPVHEADLEAPYPFPDETFDAVLCALVAEHLDRPLDALREMRRVLRPGGRLVLSVFHPDMAAAGVTARFEKDGVVYRLGANPYTIDDYEKLFAEAGFHLKNRHEFAGDEKAIERLPGATWLVGFPVLLVLEGTKA